MSLTWLLLGHRIMYSEPCDAYFGCQRVLSPPTLDITTPSLHPVDPCTALWGLQSAGGGRRLIPHFLLSLKKGRSATLATTILSTLWKRRCAGWQVFGCKFWCKRKKKTHVGPRNVVSRCVSKTPWAAQNLNVAIKPDDEKQRKLFLYVFIMWLIKRIHVKVYCKCVMDSGSSWCSVTWPVQWAVK